MMGKFIQRDGLYVLTFYGGTGNLYCLYHDDLLYWTLTEHELTELRKEVGENPRPLREMNKVLRQRATANR